MMKRYQSRPTEALAYQFTGEMGPGMEYLPAFKAIETHDTGAVTYERDKSTTPAVVLRDGHLLAVEKGDWIVQEPDGNGFYPVKDSIFRRRYVVE